MEIEGIKVEIQPSSFVKAMALKKAIADALRRDGIDLDLGNVEINEDNPLQSKVDSRTIGSLIENGLAIATDEKLREALFDCCDKVVLFGADRLAVNASFFDNVERWQYYYPIMIEVVKVNITPFFGKLSSMFSGAKELMGKALK